MTFKKFITGLMCISICGSMFNPVLAYAGGTNKKAVWETDEEVSITTTYLEEKTTTSTTTTKITTISTEIKTEKVGNIENLPNKAYIDVTPIYQGELLTGCEATGLTILLRYYGYPVSKEAIALDYMPRQDFYYAGGRKIGPDYHEVFAGDPRRTLGSYGCYIPCMVQTVTNFATDVGAKIKATDLTGTDFYDLLSYVADGTPVAVLTSNRLIEPIKGDSWYTSDGELITWQRGHHCMIITGYDLKKGLIYVSESAYSYKTTYYIDDFISVYNAKGKNAMILSK